MSRSSSSLGTKSEDLPVGRMTLGRIRELYDEGGDDFAERADDIVGGLLAIVEAFASHFTSPTRDAMCAWCMAVSLGPEAMRAHVVVCDANPVVRELTQVREELTQVREELAARKWEDREDSNVED